MKKIISQKQNGGMVDETTLGDRVYCPDKGDIISLQLDIMPTQTDMGLVERKIALVVSPKAYNSKTRLALVCPVQAVSKGYPFEVALPIGFAMEGVILADHLHSLNWLQRKAFFVEKLPSAVLDEITKRIQLLIES